MNNSKVIGNSTEIHCITSFMDLGYNVSIPFGDCERYDFIADCNGVLLRIQCKTATIQDGGSSFLVNGRSSVKKNKKVSHRRYTKDEIDFFATYFNSNCYLIPVEEMGSSKVLRIIPPKNYQKDRINLAEDYLLENILKCN